MDDANDSPVYLKVVELCFFHRFDFAMCMWPQVSRVPQNGKWQIILSPMMYRAQHVTCAIHHETAQARPCNLAYQ